jgi:hypothetical protein
LRTLPRLGRVQRTCPSIGLEPSAGLAEWSRFMSERFIDVRSGHRCVERTFNDLLRGRQSGRLRWGYVASGRTTVQSCERTTRADIPQLRGRVAVRALPRWRYRSTGTEIASTRGLHRWQALGLYMPSGSGLTYRSEGCQHVCQTVCKTLCLTDSHRVRSICRYALVSAC